MAHYLHLGYQPPNLATLNGHFQIYKMILSFCWSHIKQWLVLIDLSTYAVVLGGRAHFIWTKKKIVPQIKLPFSHLPSQIEQKGEKHICGQATQL